MGKEKAKAPAQIKRKKGTKVHSLYDKTKLKTEFCPKCGPGVYLAVHKNRTTCGKCGYTQFKKKE
ncbi:30S ribosomal protein S27ae [Candidatus Woesearchaeota archaeon]|nr:MAG: small subunit ribosomal protein S27Ae [archaeon GW2011_AR4]MBS3129654.1 30S ribosomal protein S27ae [Candidatus Woesearchaeota archaeon]HIH38758.1 30S ribosomal protein S27ae [Candidatus Woesearchaeota archaeon]HIH49174.1 30S ribosomal protein S27ae [Candidatus Woesearchaeota archaeon]HIJ03316.1 30S ribosomal protein S27ae [Candidatus Woesearchaeota archaeon]